MPGIALWVEFTAKPGQGKALEALIRDHAARTLSEEDGCERFDVLTPAEGGNVLYLYEVYRDDEAFDLHRNSRLLKETRAAYAPLVADVSLKVCNL